MNPFKKAILIFFLSATGLLCKAQLGFEFAANTFINSYNYRATSQSGWGNGAGLGLNLPVVPSVYIRTELNYQRRLLVTNDTRVLNATTYSEKVKYKYRTTYHTLDIPVMVVLNADKPLRFIAGLQYGKVLQSYLYYHSEDSYTDLQTGQSSTGEYEDKRINDNPKWTELSFHLGFGYHFGNGLSVELRGQRSLLHFEEGETISDVSWGIVQLGLRYDLLFAKKAKTKVQ